MTSTQTAPQAFEWSSQNVLIFNHFESAESILQHVIIRARAGTGKTTTLIEIVKRLPRSSQILICAFSKIIQLELEKRIGSDYPNIVARTLHALGLSCIKKFRDRIRVSFGSDRADGLSNRVCEKSAPDAIKRLVSKLHTKGREIAPHATKLGDLTAIAIEFECEPDETWARCSSCFLFRGECETADHKIPHAFKGYDTQYVELKALAAMELAAGVESGDTIDGADMIFLPVRNRWLTKMYDEVLVDEAQDMTPTQLEIAQGVCRGRITIIGDDRQAVFGFRGADSECLDRLKTELDATEFGLKKTYRCGQKIVALAKTLVPDFECGAAHEGSVSYLEREKLVAAAGPGDFILSRINAPLVPLAMQLLRAGKRTRIAGRDIGEGLIKLVAKFKAKSVPDLLTKIEGWQNKETQRLKAQRASATNGRKAALDAKLEAVAEQAAMLVSLTDGAKNVADVGDRAAALFSDDGRGAEGMITCSSVHRAKGLEANRVFILQNTLKNHSQEELNIQYVAVTRAKNELVFVTEPRA